VVDRVYVIQNREGKFYIGLSDDVDRRISQHNAGVSKWTRGKEPWTLCMAKRRVIAFGSAKIGKPFEATKRRPRIISSCRSAPLVRNLELLGCAAAYLLFPLSSDVS